MISAHRVLTRLARSSSFWIGLLIPSLLSFMNSLSRPWATICCPLRTMSTSKSLIFNQSGKLSELRLQCTLGARWRLRKQYEKSSINYRTLFRNWFECKVNSGTGWFLYEFSTAEGKLLSYVSKAAWRVKSWQNRPLKKNKKQTHYCSSVQYFVVLPKFSTDKWHCAVIHVYYRGTPFHH